MVGHPDERPARLEGGVSGKRGRPPLYSFPRRKRGRPPGISGRVENILARLDRGDLGKKIAADLGITHQAVSFIKGRYRAETVTSWSRTP
jgi:hypothetical protein